MTVLTKASDMVRKPDLMSAPLVVENRFDPERAHPRATPRTHVWVYRSQCSLFMLCFTLFTAVMLLAGAVLGLVYYSDAQDVPRYKGYCAVPIEMPRDVRLQKQAALAASRMPLRWSPEPDVSVFAGEEQAAADALSSLLERFDIDDNVEKISVYNSGHNVEFIHDFNANATGIVDKERCFTMELDPSVVLSPSVLVVSIERGLQFDVMRVRSRLRAALPDPALESAALESTSLEPRPQAAVFVERCIDKPTYHLERDDNIIRKRSADEPAHEYLYFAGKHIQEIAIENLPDVLAYEKARKA